MRALLAVLASLLLLSPLLAQERDDAARRRLLEGLDRRDPAVLDAVAKGDDSLLARRARYYLDMIGASELPSSAAADASAPSPAGGDGSWARAFAPARGERWSEAWRFRHGWRDPVRAWRLRDLDRTPVIEDFGPAARERYDALARERLRAADAEGGDVRRAASYWLMRRGTETDRALALAGLRDSDPVVAARMARLLARVGGPDAVGPLVAAVLEREERSPRVNALRALGALGDRGGLVAVVAALKSEDPHLQRSALETLDAIAEKAVLETEERRGLTAFVWAILTRDPVLDVRRAAVKPLARLSPKSLRLFLVRARQGEPWPLRAECARALGREPELDLDWLDRFLADPDRRVGAAAVEALAARSDASQARRRLWRVVETSRDDVQLELALTALAERLAPSAGPVTERADDLRSRLGRATERVYSVLPAAQAESKQACLKAARLLDDARSRRFLARVAAEDPEYAVRNFARRHLLELGVPEGELPAARPAAPHPPEMRDLAWSFLNGAGPKEAVLTTRDGEIVLRLHGERAPFTCAVFTTLARRGFYDGLLFHRVIPDFVAQAGCPRGDGWGGPGFSQRCEINGLEYRRGTVGMALAGQDTGGSQFFICFEAQPHLDGRYPIFGQVTEGLDVLDALTQGRRIESIVIE